MNLIVGDSGIGKTPLLIQMGIAVASGLPFFGRPTVPGRVLYVDCESSVDSFGGILRSISAWSGLPAPPRDFLVYSPNWDGRPERAPEALLSVAQAVEEFKPALVIIDPLRVVWPRAEMKSEDTITMINQQRALSTKTGCAWVNIHHCRKPNQENPHPINLANDPHGWLLEAAGSRALVNQTDTRIGIVRGNDLLVAGFTRVLGAMPPFSLRRVTDDQSGDPIAYQLVAGSEAVTPWEMDFLNHLPSDFSSVEARNIYANMKGGKPSNNVADKHVTALKAAGLVRHRGGRMGYEKTAKPLVSTT